eukprot:scaffold7433_cov152-Isochrysis_galbana.AAC.3
MEITDPLLGLGTPPAITLVASGLMGALSAAASKLIPDRPLAIGCAPGRAGKTPCGPELSELGASWAMHKPYA